MTHADQLPAEPLRPLITAGQAAVRAAERHGSPEALAGLNRALSALPITHMDSQAHEILHTALRAVRLAEDAQEWKALEELVRALTQTLHTGDATESPAVQAMMLLLSQCSARCGQYDRGGDVTRNAWERAFQAGAEALSALLRVLRKERRKARTWTGP